MRLFQLARDLFLAQAVELFLESLFFLLELLLA
jgi:hypothetical protein